MTCSRRSPIYLDYNATTPLDPEIRGLMLDTLDQAWGNPSSIHQYGRRARALLDEAREKLAAVLGCRPTELVFTSGGTEANNLAIFGSARRLRSRGHHLVCSPIEHPAVLQCFEHLTRSDGFSLTLLPVDSLGRISPHDVAEALRPDTILVSVMAANNEIGSVQPVAEIGAICRARNVLFHTDAVQWLGKAPFNGIDALQADLVSFCAHKIHGPKGVGALYVRSPFAPESLLFGGSHEHERRAGTENLPAIVAFAEAASLFVRPPVFDPGQLLPRRHRLEEALSSIPGVTILGPPDGRLPNTLAFTVDGSDSLAILAALDLAGVCASSGSACAVGSLEPSHVLEAMGLSRSQASSLVRLSLGRENSDSDIDQVCSLLPSVIAQVRPV